MNLDILDTSTRIVFFPVRHHSPTCARLVKELALEMRPSIILIEGPSDFNPQINELTLPHQLPIAIYSYVKFANDIHRGAYYPFCIYSPEWQALQTAKEMNIDAKFIDLAWAKLANQETHSQRYADGDLRQSAFITTLCQKLGVETFDSLWDTLFEIDKDLSLPEYLKRAHFFCFQLRTSDKPSLENKLREAFMASQIQQALSEQSGKILVVTGGYHSYALFASINQIPFEVEPPLPTKIPDLEEIEKGIALTPYSYNRLDSLTGYEAGMPSPGFYHHVWQERTNNKKNAYRILLSKAVKELREKKQIVSTADLIAVETTAWGLAELRGHKEIWRQDLVDAIISSLVKDELEYGLLHPFLATLYEIFCGSERGVLAVGTTIPPLVQDLQELLSKYDLTLTNSRRFIELDLFVPTDLIKSQTLHCLQFLQIKGYKLVEHTDLSIRKDLSKILEKWELIWSPDFQTSTIEASIYGTTLLEAVTSKVCELQKNIEKDAQKAALLLLDASLMGLNNLPPHFYKILIDIIRKDSNFFSVTTALDHLLYLYRYDEIFGTKGLWNLGWLVKETFSRSLWLLELLGNVQGKESALIQNLTILLQTFENCNELLASDKSEFTVCLQRINSDQSQMPLLRGASIAILWRLGESLTEQVLEDLRFYSDPSFLGDFLTGLFSLAREEVQRHSEILFAIDSLLLTYDDKAFLEAIPALRLAFSYFTPREKHYMAANLLKGLKEELSLPTFEANSAILAQAVAFEAKLFKTLKLYGLRGKNYE